jgi:hypothetical protein
MVILVLQKQQHEHHILMVRRRRRVMRIMRINKDQCCRVSLPQRAVLNSGHKWRRVQQLPRAPHRRPVLAFHMRVHRHRRRGDRAAVGRQRELEKENHTERDMVRREKNIKPDTKRKKGIKKDVKQDIAADALSIAANQFRRPCSIPFAIV